MTVGDRVVYAGDPVTGPFNTPIPAAWTYKAGVVLNTLDWPASLNLQLHDDGTVSHNWTGPGDLQLWITDPSPVTQDPHTGEHGQVVRIEGPGSYSVALDSGVTIVAREDQLTLE